LNWENPSHLGRRHRLHPADRQWPGHVGELQGRRARRPPPL